MDTTTDREQYYEDNASTILAACGKTLSIAADPDNETIAFKVGMLGQGDWTELSAPEARALCAAFGDAVERIEAPPSGIPSADAVA